MGALTITTKRVRNSTLKAGIKKHLAGRSSIVLRGVRYAPDDLVALLDEHATALDDSTQAKAEWLAKARAEKALEKKLSPVLLAFREFLVVEYGSNTVLVDFGERLPKKTGPKTLKAKVASAEQSQKTRVLRGTKGKRQKAKLGSGK